jgi:hypothetical protein
MRKQEEMSQERLRTRDQARELYKRFHQQSHFTEERMVTVKWTTQPTSRFGPLRRLRRTWHESTESRKVLYLNPPDNTVLMMEDGGLAYSKGRQQHFVSFDFTTASPEDFQTIKEVIDQWWKLHKRIG